VRAGLLDPVRSGIPGQRDEMAERRQRPLPVDRQDGDRPRGVIPHHQEVAGGVHGDANPVLAAGGLLIQELQLAGRLVDREGRGVLAVTVARVEEALLAIERQPGRVDEVPHQLHVRPLARGRVHPVHVDAFATGVALPRRVAPDIREHRGGLPCRSGARPGHRRASPGGDCRQGADGAAQEVSAADVPTLGLTVGEHDDPRRARSDGMILDSRSLRLAQERRCGRADAPVTARVSCAAAATGRGRGPGTAAPPARPSGPRRAWCRPSHRAPSSPASNFGSRRG